MLAGVRCTWLEPGQVTFQSTLACQGCALSGRNPCGLPAPVIFQVTRERDPDVVRCSSTMLGGCPREHAIKKHHAWFVDPKRTYTRAIGTLTHRGAEESMLSQSSKFETERRYYRDFSLPDGRVATVSAALDVLIEEPDGTFIIQDYKTTASLALSKLRRKVADYVPQFSIQRWILAGQSKTVSRVDLHFMAHTGNRRINLFPDGEADIPEATLMSLEETELYFDERLPALLDGLEGAKLPPVLDDPAAYWRCAYCDVKERCQELAGSPLPAFH